MARMRVSARENRKFIGRAIQYLAGRRASTSSSLGCRTASNVHEVAQAINPGPVVYVDNDPLAAGARAGAAHGARQKASAPTFKRTCGSQV